MLVGDSINMQFIVMTESGWLGRIFLVSYLVIFVIAVHNIFISIITKFYAKKKPDYKDTKLALKMV
jgi:hypothetical protein